MLRKYLKFYIISFTIIFSLLFLFYNKMNSTYEAKENFTYFKIILNQFFNKEKIEINEFKIKNHNNIGIVVNNNKLSISIDNIDYRSCLKYGVDYIESDFQSFKVNGQLFTRKDVVTRDIILDNCNKKFNNITLNAEMEKK